EALARSAAVVGDPFDLDLAGVVAGLDPGARLKALDELAARDLVRPETAPRCFGFRHPVVRLALYEGAPAGWCLAAHARAAATLALAGAPLAARAHHLALSAAPGDEDAVDVLAAAGEAASARAPMTAAYWLEAALRVLVDGGSSPRRLQLLTARAAALGTAGHLRESRDALHEVLAQLPSGASPAQARAVATCARAEHLLGNHAQAI